MKALLRYGPAVLCMAVIFYLSHQTGDDLGALLPFFQQVLPSLTSFDPGHFVAYFLLALTFVWALGRHALHPWGKALVVALCLAYGVTDEFHQSFVPGRSPDLMDLRNDGIGALIAVLLISLPPFSRRLRNRFLS
ncbi:VanZ family protein [Paenibacillus koleovorans]|uniref:VanZ family protein n=1 Tax=Paenibacillus koleovorans TaxID=121608 RepID=UPI000FD8DE38|nr:VanZ family protein [Paenibacillus koleovorans]